MKKIVSILLALILLVGLVPMSAFAGSHPSDTAPARDWEQYAEYAEKNTSDEDAAEAYKKAAEKYSKYIIDEVFYFGHARDCYNKAIELFKREKMFGKVLECYEAIGDAAFGCGKNQEALDAYKKAVELAEDTDTEDWYLAVLQEKLGDAYMSFKVYNDAAFEYGHALQNIDSSNEAYPALCLKYAQALEADGLASDPEGEMIIARAFTDAAGALVTKGSEEEAIAVMKNGAKHYEKAGSPEYAQRAYAALILEFAQAGKMNTAASLCFELYEAYGAHEYTAALFTNIALPYYESIKDYESAALVNEKAGDCYKSLGDKELAKLCYEEAADYYEKAGNTSGAAAMREKAKSNFGVGTTISKGNDKTFILILLIVISILVIACIFFRRRSLPEKK